MQDGPCPIQVGDFLTLPIYVFRGRLLEKLPAFGKAKVRPEYFDPDYCYQPYEATEEWLSKLHNSADVTITTVREWREHFSAYLYYVQFKEDVEHEHTRRLNDHTELVSALCDSRLAIDTAEMWKAFEAAHHFQSIHSEYRQDTDRQNKFGEYSERLAKAWKHLGPSSRATRRLIERIVRSIQLQSSSWSQFSNSESKMPKLPISVRSPQPARHATVFFCYARKDESLRDELGSHLAALSREGVIKGWHDRKIGPGKDWEEQIDEHLNSASIILLLVSADFLASNYCYDVEMKRALERHRTGDAVVIPVVLRACDWVKTPFATLQALPKGGRAVTSWPDRDEAFTDIAKGIRRAVEDMLRSPEENA